MDMTFKTIEAPAAPKLHPQDRVGRIVAVTGAHAVILIDADSGMPPKRTPEIGTLLRVDTPRSVSLCMVSALSSPMPSHGSEEQELRIIEVEFFGELPKAADGTPMSFRRGVSSYPSLGDPRRAHCAGTGDPRHDQDRRDAGQAFRHSRHHGHRQVLHRGADPSPHPGKEPAGARAATRRAP
jgi:hypothetical protein